MMKKNHKNSCGCNRPTAAARRHSVGSPPRRQGEPVANVFKKRTANYYYLNIS